MLRDSKVVFWWTKEFEDGKRSSMVLRNGYVNGGKEEKVLLEGWEENVWQLVDSCLIRE